MEDKARGQQQVVPFKVFTFKAPEELDEALFEVVKRKNTAQNRVTKSSLVCDILTSHPEISKELAKILRRKKQPSRKVA